MKRFTRRDQVYKNPVINSDSFDKRRFNELLFMSKGLKRVRQNGQALPLFDQLMGDIWSSFYKNNPQLLGFDEIKPELKNNYQLMDRVMSDETYHQTHELTKLDDLHSALSTIGFSEKIFEWIEEQTEQNQEMQKAFDNMQQHEQNHSQNSKEFQKAMEEFAEALGEQINQSGEAFSKMLQQSVAEANETGKSLQELVSGLEAGRGRSQELKQMPLRDQFTLAEYLKANKKMKEIAKWAGNFKAIAQSKQKKKSKEALARSGIKMGGDIDSLLPNEMINLSIPEARADFLRRLVEGQTLQYANKGKQSLGKGSIILLLDESGSMRYKENQSKGFVLAIMAIARRQKRDFALITFDDFTKTTLYPKGKITSKQMVEMCEHFMGGGTNFTKPLNESLNLIKKDRFKNADIVFVTDGQDHIDAEFLNSFIQNKRKLGFSVLSLLIGDDAKSHTVENFSDRIHHAKDFKDENAHDVFNI